MSGFQYFYCFFVASHKGLGLSDSIDIVNSKKGIKTVYFSWKDFYYVATKSVASKIYLRRRLSQWK